MKLKHREFSRTKLNVKLNYVPSSGGDLIASIYVLQSTPNFLILSLSKK